MDLTKLNDLAPKLDDLNETELMAMLTSLETLLKKTRDCITAKTTPKDKPSPPKLVDDNLFRFDDCPDIDKKLLTEVLEFVKTLEYHPSSNNPNSPEIHLFGDQKYPFNEQSSNVTPSPIVNDSPLCKLVAVVSGIVGVTFTSVLINRFRNVNCCLGPHKDDEKCLNVASPISALSLGEVTRRLQISVNKKKHKPVKTVMLTPGSLFTMLPGFQDLYYHAIAAGRTGRKGIDKENGVRYSVTFRCLVPNAGTADDLVTVPVNSKEDKEATPADNTDTNDNMDTAVPHNNNSSEAPDTFVFGSSLLKGLDEKILSKYSKNFKVVCNRGARVRNIYEDIERMREHGAYDTTKVSSVFLLCGGNDLENFDKAYSINDNIKFLFEDMEDLVELTREVFPLAKINYISLIPRKSQYNDHIRYMHQVNDWLNSFCKKESIRFVDIFSFFLLKTSSSWMLLNDKLFNTSKLHFSRIGDSVLAKVLMGVANKPR